MGLLIMPIQKDRKPIDEAPLEKEQERQIEIHNII
jgi:hypothetical protein